MPNRNYTSEIIDNLLVGLVFGGLAAAILVAPNSVQALEKPLMRFVNGRDKRRETKRIARYLKQQKLVKVSANDDGSFSITLTDKGRVRAARAQFERLTLPAGRWDKKWRIVMFDIPEKYKPTRDYLSFHLKRIGFRQLQRSVFVFPHPVDDFMAIVNELFPETGKFIIYLTADDIDAGIHNQLIKSFKALYNSHAIASEL